VKVTVSKVVDNVILNLFQDPIACQTLKQVQGDPIHDCIHFGNSLKSNLDEKTSETHGKAGQLPERRLVAREVGRNLTLTGFQNLSGFDLSAYYDNLNKEIGTFGRCRGKTSYSKKLHKTFVRQHRCCYPSNLGV
jgi:hypothetical protein